MNLAKYHKVLLGLLTFVIFLVLFIVPKLKNRSLSTSEESVLKTEIIDYKQTYVPNGNKAGSCWTTSIAAQNNDGAYRCTVGDLIFDPCFKTEEGKVVCEVDPEVEGSGFELMLTEDLPVNETTTSYYKESAFVWMVKLDNGLRCYLNTGAAEDVNGELSYYACDKNVVLVGHLIPREPYWIAKVAYFTDGSRENTVIEEHEILNIWK